MSPRFRLTPRLLAALFATWVVWSTTYLAIEYALESIPPFYQMGTRFVVAGGLMLAYMRFRGAPWPTAAQWRFALYSGALMIGVGYGGTAYAELTVGSGLVATFIAVVPMMIALIQLGFGIRPKPMETVGMAVGLLGIVLLTQGAGFNAAPVGLLAITLACVAWSLGSVFTQRWWHLAPGAMGYGSQMLSGGLLLMGAGALAGETLFQTWTPGAWAAWVYLVVAGSLIGYTAYFVLMHEAPAALASSYTFVNPVLALVLMDLFTPKTVTAYEWGCSALILCGVVMLVWANRHVHEEPPAPPEALMNPK